MEVTEADVFIDDFRLQDLGLYVKLSSQEPILPPTRDLVVEIPGMNGAYDYGADFQPRPFDLDCMFEQMSFTDLKFKVRELIRLFVDGYGRPKTVKLKFGDEMDKFYFVRVSGGVPLDRLTGMPSFTLPLTAFDPNAYSVVNNDEITWGSEEITFASSYLLGTIGAGTHEITAPTTIVETVNGYTLKPLFNINGTGTNVIVSSNGKSFSLGTFTNTSWVIDGDRWTVLKNGANGLSDYNKNYPSGDWIELINGDNEITISGTGLNLTFEVRFRDKYM